MDNHAYVIVSQPVTWAAARDDCAARGGHLATITSAEEQSFIVRESSQALWIGGSDLEQEGTFRWVTGEPFAFTAWVAREPDDYNGQSDCVNLGLDKGWHDRICDEPNPYVCEFD
jgi:hypothetical protein